MSYKSIECDSLSNLITEATKARRQFESTYSPSAILFFRGHCSSDYRLLPGLFRPVEQGFYQDFDEKNLYYEFRARAGALLDPNYSSWDILFLMQHHGVPTRLLDWTESFAAALYFALEGAKWDADIWMLDPYLLNRSLFVSESIIDVGLDLGAKYFDLFIRPNKSVHHPNSPVIAIYPRRQIARLASQTGLFTLHFSSDALEDLDGAWLTRFHLQAQAVADTQMFLRLMGINGFSLFPDLDGLARLLRTRIKGGYGIVP